MKAVFLLLAAAAFASAVTAWSDESASDDSGDYGRTTTMMPCPGWCTKEYMPVCAKDRKGRPYMFGNECEMRQCRCRMYLRLVDFDECPDNAPGCPLPPLAPQPHVVGRSDESSDESQSAASADVSLQDAHRVNSLRKTKPVFV